MKIQVGKKYRNGFGTELLVESKSDNGPKGFPFLATIPFCTAAHWFSETGQYLNCTVPGYDLRPTKVKKEGWVVILTAGRGNPDVCSDPDRRFDSQIHSSAVSAAAVVTKLQGRFPLCSYQVEKITWEQDE